MPDRLGQPIEDLIDVREAAARAGRHPETIRRWVWSGRITARRAGNRLMVRVADVDALAGSAAARDGSLAAWSARARALRAGTAGGGRSATDLVLADRRDRDDRGDRDAGR